MRCLVVNAVTRLVDREYLASGSPLSVPPRRLCRGLECTVETPGARELQAPPRNTMPVAITRTASNKPPMPAIGAATSDWTTRPSANPKAALPNCDRSRRAARTAMQCGHDHDSHEGNSPEYETRRRRDAALGDDAQDHADGSRNCPTNDDAIHAGQLPPPPLT